MIDDDPSVLPEGRLDLLAIDRRLLEELGRQAARLLLDRMNHRGAGESPARRIVIPTTVVEYGPVAARIGAAR